ncbi:MAG: MobC family plasmid mobilization relaxosome protein [Ruminococcus sp.]|nr:MobC family plasmid mobilization relaxosome protein [Ruminococcus sp.]MCM1381828.1 MobC family plasmid mobilization relaxosome protein [Muribaculaceae bacterium]MCM1479439.1 MobC family plasmid mobilization relaxosome protein [Muribaculaceae bacterium]
MRNKNIKIRVTEKELARIKERAAVSDMSISGYIRKCAVNGKIILYETKNLFGLKTALKAIGKNVNQIAAVVNSTGSVYAKDIEDLKNNMQSVERTLNEYLTPLTGRDL